jgi:G:T-mismatch repair DNA endonuclease (very short patch repair protein)
MEACDCEGHMIVVCWECDSRDQVTIAKKLTTLNSKSLIPVNRIYSRNREPENLEILKHKE